MDAVNDIIKCKICHNIYENPIILSCCGGKETICKKHIYETKLDNNIFTCLFCNSEHDLTKESFLQNETIQKLLNYDFDKFKFDKIYYESKSMCLDLEKLKNELKTLLDNPNNSIDNHISNLRVQIDLRREIFKTEIDKISDKMLKELENFKFECLINLECNKIQEKYSKKLKLMDDELDLAKCFKDLNSLGTDLSKLNSYLHDTTYQVNQISNLISSFKNELFVSKTSSFVNTISLEKFITDYSKHLCVEPKNNRFITLKLNHLSKLVSNETDVIESDFVVFKTSKFKIVAQIFKDNDNEFYLSYYLNCKSEDEKETRFREIIYVDASMKVLCVKEPSRNMVKRMRVFFDKEELLGFPNFIKIKDLTEENNGLYDKNNDFCVLEIEFNEFTQ